MATLLGNSMTRDHNFMKDFTKEKCYLQHNFLCQYAHPIKIGINVAIDIIIV